MVTLLTIQVLSIVAAALTNLVGILAFATDYWSTITYDLAKLPSGVPTTIAGNATDGAFHLVNAYSRPRTVSLQNQYLTSTLIHVDNETVLYPTHKGIFRQCNYLSSDMRQQLKLSACRLLKLSNNRFDDGIHGMSNPGRELIRECLRFRLRRVLLLVGVSCSSLNKRSRRVERSRRNTIYAVNGAGRCAPWYYVQSL